MLEVTSRIRLLALTQPLKRPNVRVAAPTAAKIAAAKTTLELLEMFHSPKGDAVPA